MEQILEWQSMVLANGINEVEVGQQLSRLNLKYRIVGEIVPVPKRVKHFNRDTVSVQIGKVSRSVAEPVLFRPTPAPGTFFSPASAPTKKYRLRLRNTGQPK